MENTYRVQKILKKMENYNNSNIVIKSDTKEFSIKLSKENIPHLLGLHYMEKKEDKIPAYKKINYIFKENISDQDILDKVNENNGEKQMINVKNRIETFDSFINNLEKGIIVEKTLEKGKMNINYLIVQSKNDDFYHLGILAGNNGTILEEFGQINKDVLKTYFIENNIDYFEKTKIMEEVKEISRYSEDLEEYIPFSFDENKNRALIEEYKKGNKINYKEFLKEYEKNEKVEEKWNKRESINNERER